MTKSSEDGTKGGVAGTKPSYAHGRDFGSFLLQTPVTNEPEYEIRIKASNLALKKYQDLLKEKNVMFRRAGLEIFPPPIFILADRSMIVNALSILHSWYENNRGKENIEVSILLPDASVQQINGADEIQELINKLER
jgi:hypothetical protein